MTKTEKLGMQIKRHQYKIEDAILSIEAMTDLIESGKYENDELDFLIKERLRAQMFWNIYSRKIEILKGEIEED